MRLLKNIHNLNKSSILILVLALPILAESSERSFTIGISGYNAVRPFAEAVVEEPRKDFRWFGARWRYSLGGVGVFRDYKEDELGWYSSFALFGSLGRIEAVGGLFAFDLTAAAHFSRIPDGYEYVEIIAGPRIQADYTFWMEQTHIKADGVFLVGNNLLVAWGELRFYPLQNVCLGLGLHYDGELDQWGDTPFMKDHWDNGINYYLLVGYKFELRN